MSIMLRDYTTGQEIAVDARQIDDDLARRLIPQDDVTQQLFTAARSGGASVIKAMSLALMLRAVVARRQAR